MNKRPAGVDSRRRVIVRGWSSLFLLLLPMARNLAGEVWKLDPRLLRHHEGDEEEGRSQAKEEPRRITDGTHLSEFQVKRIIRVPIFHTASHGQSPFSSKIMASVQTMPLMIAAESALAGFR